MRLGWRHQSFVVSFKGKRKDSRNLSYSDLVASLDFVVVLLPPPRDYISSLWLGTWYFRALGFETTRALVLCVWTQLLTERVHIQRASTRQLLPSWKSILFDFFWKVQAELALGADALIWDLHLSISLACGTSGFFCSRGQELVLILHLDCHSSCMTGLKSPPWYQAFAWHSRSRVLSLCLSPTSYHLARFQHGAQKTFSFFLHVCICCYWSAPYKGLECYSWVTGLLCLYKDVFGWGKKKARFIWVCDKGIYCLGYIITQRNGVLMFAHLAVQWCGQGSTCLSALSHDWIGSIYFLFIPT